VLLKALLALVSCGTKVAIGRLIFWPALGSRLLASIWRLVRRHLADKESSHRGIATGLLRVTLFVFFCKLAGAGKEMAIAWRYGVSATSDAYLFVLNLANWPVAVWFTVLTVVLVPLLAQIRHHHPDELPRFRAELLGLTLIVGLGLGLLSVFGLPLLLHADWVSLSNKVLAAALDMATPLSLIVPTGVVISLLSAWMLSSGDHRNTLLEAIPALVILVALLLPQNLLPEPLIWGTVAGSAMHLAALAVPLKRRGELQAPRFVFASPAWASFWGSIGIMSMGQVLMSLTSIIDQFFANGIGPGALSTLSYANRVLTLILGIGAMGITRAILPVLAKVRMQKGADVDRLAYSWAKWVFVAGGIAAVIGWFGSDLVVSLLFERGEFKEQNTAEVAAVLKYSMFQIPFFMFSLTLANLMASKENYRILFFSSVNALTLKIVSAAVLIPLIGMLGLVMSTTIMYLGNSLLFFFVLKGYFKKTV
jgi:putative peptidoglycan lipid II flippase